MVLRGPRTSTPAVRVRTVRVEPGLGILALSRQLSQTNPPSGRSRIGAAHAISGPADAAVERPALVLAAQLVDADDRIEDRVLLLLVPDVSGVLRIEVVQPRNNRTDVRCHAGPFDCKAVFGSVPGSAELVDRVSGRM